jgi:hypothetical protein
MSQSCTNKAAARSDAGQMDMILKLATDEKAIVHVIPFAVCAHANTNSNVALLEFDENSRERPVMYVEGLFTNLYQDREAIEYLREAALSPRDPTSLITEIGSKSAKAETETKEVRTGDAMPSNNFCCRNDAGRRECSPQRFGGPRRSPPSTRKACVERPFSAETCRHRRHR